MKRYAFLVRGINVGGRNKVVMEKFRHDLDKLGFKNVSSYINSGNFFFDSPMMKEELLLDKDQLKRVINSFDLADETLHFGELGIYWGKYDKTSYNQTAYHKTLLKSSFYPYITIRNARTFSNIGHYLKNKELKEI